MSTFNLDINQCSQDQFLRELLVSGKQIYRNFLKLAKTTGGIIILLPLLLALPITYILVTGIFIFYAFKLRYVTREILKISVRKDNYKDAYLVYLGTKQTLNILEAFNKSGSQLKLLLPLLFFTKLFYSLLSSSSKHLESQLFEIYNPKIISKVSLISLKEQLSAFENDWDDDVLWKDFQIKYHDMTN
jgi:hypothetical protein